MAETRRQLLEQQLAQSQQLLQQAQNPDLFGNGRAGAFGAIAQGITAGIGAYGKAKARREILVNESQNIDLFKQFAISKGNQPLADVAGSLSPETREAYILQSTSPRYTSFNQFTPAKIQEFEYYQNLPSEDLRKQFLNVQRNTTGEGAFLKQGGAIEVLPNYGQAGAQKKGLETGAQKSVELVYEPEIKRETKKQETVGEKQGTEVINEITAPQTNNIIQEAKKLLPQSTSGLPQRSISGSAAILGISTDMNKADKQLQILSGKLISNVPRFKGADSDKDTALYKQMAGDIANPNVPYKSRLAALEEIEKLNNKYIKKTPAQQGSIEKSTIVKRYNPQTGRIE